MENKLNIPAFEITQPITKFYVGKISAKDLINMCNSDMSNIRNSEYDIYQRKINEKRIPSLKEYMQYSKATFPNGVILNAKYPIKFKDGILEIENKEDAFFIIDGQHRIEALKSYRGETPFEICVIIFEDINEDLQTEIFVTVNSEQKKVNPTVRLNLKGNDEVDTPEKVIRKIAIALNDSKMSPFENRINFSDEWVRKGELKMSLATFMRPLLKKIYRTEKSFIVKDILCQNKNKRMALIDNNISFDKPLWDFYVNSEDEMLYLMLLNYFTAVSDVFYEDWRDADSLLSKTSGYDALIMLFCDVLEQNRNDMSYDNLYKILQPLKSMQGNFKLSEIGVGNSAAVRLYHMFEEILFKRQNNKIDYIDFFEEE